ncbi:MAG: potassium-transporting ATPase subunit KdpC [Actinobacteria bacterium]|nr:potassium-transporting ATPase subunit KdpC [Actinomycetota bacterium]
MSRMPSFIRQHLAGLRVLIALTVITGIAYPLLVFGVAQLAFHHQANGSMVSYQGKVAGSSQLCQEFTDAKGNPLPQYFQPRASNAVNPESKTDYGCDPGFSAASNLGPNNAELTKTIKQRRAEVAKFNGVSPASVPPDAVTASASGLDPDISPQYAYLQVNRVARARHASPAAIRALVSHHITGRAIGFLGEPGVDVLTLNIALNQKFPPGR